MVEIWSVEEGEPAKIQTMRDMKDNIYAVSLSSDGKNIAIGKLSGSIEIFNIGQDEPRITLRGNFLIGENETRITINMINKLKILSLMVVNENILLSGNNHDEFEVWNLAEKTHQYDKTNPRLHGDNQIRDAKRRFGCCRFLWRFVAFETAGRRDSR